MRRAATVLLVSLAFAGCGPSVGAEGGPCTAGGACDDGLTCLSNLCVDDDDDGGGAEGEGEGDCRGDAGGDNDLGDCATLPSGCADITDACEAGFLTLRAGLAQGAFDCFAAEQSCADPEGTTSRCFSSLSACDNASAQTICGRADQACQDASDTGFDRTGCEGDLKPMNDDFIVLYTDCFNGNLNQPCNVLHDACFEDAFARLVNE
jgi:hypothetical protein